MYQFMKNVVEIFGIVYLRFRLLPRVWCVWLVAINAVSLFFIQHIEAQVVLAVTLLSVILQAFIYQRTGFSRIMGIVHISWIPMFIWMVSRSEAIVQNPDLFTWLIVLFATNAVSLFIDTIDSIRYIRGERAPHYCW